MDEARVKKLRDDIFDLCLASKLNMLECASAAYSVYVSLKEDLESKTGGEVYEIRDVASAN